MKTSVTRLFAILLISQLVSSIHAATNGVYTTSNVANPVWTDTVRWLDGVVPNGVGDTAQIHQAQTGGNRVFSLPTDVILGGMDIQYERTVAGNPLAYTFNGNSTTLTFNNGGLGASVLITNGNNSTTGSTQTTYNIPIVLADDLAVNNNAGTQLLTFTGGVTAASGSRTLTAAAGDVIFSGAIGDGSGQVGLLVSGGTTILSAGNTYTGGTTVASGSTLQLGNGGTTGSVVGEVVNNGTLMLNRTGTFSANISGSGGLTRTGVSGTLTLEGTNTYEGGTTILGATLAINSNANLGEASGTITLNGGTLNVATAAGDVTMSRNLIMGASGGTFAVNSSNNTTTMNGDVSGGGNLAKSSAGRLILNGTGTNTGTITQNAGTLLINGDFSAATGAVTVNSAEGAPSTFGGAGTVGGNTSLSGASNKLSPGADSRRDMPNNSTGLLTFSNGGLGGDVTLTLSSVTTAIFELGGTNRGAALDGFDAVNVEGLLTYEGTLTISLIGGFTPVVNDTFNLFDFGSQSGTFSGGVVFTDVGYAGSFDHSTGVLTITAVPEPAVWAFAGMGLVLLVVRRRPFRS